MRRLKPYVVSFVINKTPYGLNGVKDLVEGEKILNSNEAYRTPLYLQLLSNGNALEPDYPIEVVVGLIG